MDHSGFRLTAGVRSHPGMRREVNEDAVLATDPFYLVADGVGGQEGGAQASGAALAVFEQAGTPGAPAPLHGIEQAINDARTAVGKVRAAHLPHAGSTLTGIIRTTHEGISQWYVLNIGDSRVYLWRNGELLRLTADHSLHEELSAVGHPDAHLAPKNVITRALGGEDERHDSWLLPLEAGTRLLICSDGLTDEVDDADVGRVFAAGTPAEAAADRLLTMVLEAGARDNVTIVVVDVHSMTDAGEVDDVGTTIEH